MSELRMKSYHADGKSCTIAEYQAQVPGYCAGFENGLGFDSHAYSTPVKVWADTYDIYFDGEAYVGSCVCPHCRSVGNWYAGGYYTNERGDRIEYECGDCGHFAITGE